MQRPDIGLCNKALYAYLLERQEPKQRFSIEQDISIGMSGLKVLDAMIFEDKLAPSTKYGTILPSGLSQTTSIKPSNFTTPIADRHADGDLELPVVDDLQARRAVLLAARQGLEAAAVRRSRVRFQFHAADPVADQSGPDRDVSESRSQRLYHVPA